jgi:nicotinamidase-related amidase
LPATKQEARMIAQTPPDPRELCAADNAVLLVIDVQGKLAEMVHEAQRLRQVVGKVLRLADLFGVPVLMTEQYPKGLGPTTPELRELFDALSVEKHLLAKTAFGCCGDVEFNALLSRVGGGIQERRAGDVRRPVDVVVVGMETHVCVQQTVLELLVRGYRAVVLADGVSGRLPEYHRLALERFRQCGAVITCYESVAFEWARTKDHARFKEMSAVIKA